MLVYLKRYLDIFKNTSRVYIVIHSAILLLRLYKNSKAKKKEKKKIWKILLKTVIGIIRSSLFATTFASSIPFGVHYFNKLLGPGTPNKVHFYSFIWSFGILFEHPARIPEVAQYIFARWFESMRIDLKKTGRFTTDIPFFRVF